MKPIESEGKISLSFNEITKEIHFTYKGNTQRINNTEPRAEYPFLTEGEGARPGIGNKGWLNVASDIRDERGVILQQYTFANASKPLTTYRAYGFNPESGTITGMFDTNGVFRSTEEIQKKELGIDQFIPGAEQINANPYPTATEEEILYLEGIALIEEWLLKFKDIIEPGQETPLTGPTTEPTPVAPSPTSTQDAFSSVLTLPSQFKKKLADKITNFNLSTDTLEIDTDSFGIDNSATFAAGENKREVKKKLAKQDFDFLYDEKKGGLYFNENGSDKGFGNGGIIAILKGGPDLIQDNISFS